MKRIIIGLRTHKGRYCKTIGKSLGRNGKPVKKTFYFSKDEPQAALLQVLGLQAEWRRMRAAGLTVWEESSAYRKQNNLDVTKVETDVKPLTVNDAARLYLAAIELRMMAGQVSRSHFASQTLPLQKGTKAIALFPLSIIGEAKLREIVLGFAARPKIVRGRGVKQSQMSANYAKSIISTLRWFFCWCDEMGHWTPPRGLKSVFKSRPVLSAVEQEEELLEEPEVDRFSIDELRLLWCSANDFQRTLILLGLNCGFANMECTTLRQAEWKGETIERFRRKTVKTARRGSFGKWYLWPETIAHLRRNQAAPNEWGYLLLNAAGRPCIEDCTNYHKDEICHQWNRLRDRAGIRKIGFKFLRKTAAYIVRVQLGFGREIADAFLSHAEAGIIKHYSGRDWGKVRLATEAMRLYLSPMLSSQ